LNRLLSKHHNKLFPVLGHEESSSGSKGKIPQRIGKTRFITSVRSCQAVRPNGPGPIAINTFSGRRLKARILGVGC